MGRKNIGRILSLAVALTLLLSTFGVAAAGFAVDNGSLSTGLSDTYVMGDGGLGQVGSSTAWVMTSSGLTSISDHSTPAGDYVAPITGNVSVKTQIVKVGLYYESTAMEVVTLKNVQGSGFAFGYYDDNRQFHAESSTAATSVKIRRDNAGGSYAMNVTDDDGELLCSYTGDVNSQLAVVPISSAKALTSINGNPYYGGFSFYRYRGEKIHVINVLDVEDYVKGVIPYEMSASWPVEALKAQACCARTYWARNIDHRKSLGFDLYNTASDQVYRGTKSASVNSDKAVDQTAGLYVTYNGGMAQTFYFAADGGATESSQNIWVATLPYLTGVVDPYEADIEFYCKSWSKTFSTEEISTKLSQYGYEIDSLARVDLERSNVGNVIGLTMIDDDGASYPLKKADCTRFLSALGFPYTSYRFDVVYDEAADRWTVSGGGSGHNIGMSQWGAYSMASVHHKNFQEILGFYFRGVSLSRGA